MSYQQQQPQQPRTIFVLPPKSKAVGYQQNEFVPSNPPPAVARRVYHRCEVVPQNIPIRPSGPVRQVAMYPQHTTTPKRATLKRQSPSSVCSEETEEIVAELLGENYEQSGPRKRERLTHLTSEQKMDRRKMKNRVAAQNAREKKKERSQKMEDVMRELALENRRLRAENEMLRQENNEIRCTSSRSSPVGSYDNIVRDGMTFESAAFIKSLQQWEQVIRHGSNKVNRSLNMKIVLLIIKLLSLTATTNSNSSMQNFLKLKESSKILRAKTSISTNSSKTFRLSMEKRSSLPYQVLRHRIKKLRKNNRQIP